MAAIIYQIPKSAMQSGRAKTHRWALEFEPESARRLEPLMGWTSSRDTKGQVRLWFDSKDEAIAYARKNGLMYTVEESHPRKVRPKSYAANFARDRILRWTH